MRPTRTSWAVALSCTALAFALPSLLPSRAFAGEDTRVRVLVDAAGLGEAAAIVEAEVEEQLRIAVEHEGFAIDDSVRAHATVRVRVGADEDGDHTIDVDISLGGTIERLDTIECAQCEDAEVVEAIARQHPAILEVLERARSTGPDAVVDSPEPSPKRIGVLGGVGIGVAVLGVGALVVGGVEFGRGKVYDDVTRIDTELTFVNHRPAGAVLLGVGAVVLTGGVTMLVVDLVRTKKRHAKPQTGRVYPLWDAHGVGVGYSLRF